MASLASYSFQLNLPDTAVETVFFVGSLMSAFANDIRLALQFPWQWVSISEDRSGLYSEVMPSIKFSDG